VTIIRASKVGVKVGMVGSGVTVGGAGVGVHDGVALGARVTVGVGMPGVVVAAGTRLVVKAG
jgi:hypothetical protein